MKHFFFFMSCLLLTQAAKAQIITTVCGTGVSGYAGDGGPATNAKINQVNAIYSDPIGLIYICDAYNDRVRAIKDWGAIFTIAGTGAPGFTGDGGAAALADINYGQGVVVDKSGNVYFSDNNNQRIRKINVIDNVISTIAGTGMTGYGGDGGPATDAVFNQPYGLTLDTIGNLFVADQQNHRIRKINLSTGIITTVIGDGYPGSTGDGGPASAAEISYPNYIHSDGGSKIYLSDNGNHKIRVVDFSTGMIHCVAGNGTGGYTGDGMMATAAELQFPGGITVDKYGSLYIADGYNYRVRKVNPDGIISTIAGTGAIGYSGDGGMATNAMLNVPLDIAIDSSLNVYFSDNNNFRIRKIAQVPVGISDNKTSVVKNNFAIMPNPNTGSFELLLPDFSANDFSEVTITDITGKTIKKTSIYGNKHSIELGQLPKGAYLIKILHNKEALENILEIN